MFGKRIQIAVRVGKLTLALLNEVDFIDSVLNQALQFHDAFLCGVILDFLPCTGVGLGMGLPLAGVGRIWPLGLRNDYTVSFCVPVIICHIDSCSRQREGQDKRSGEEQKKYFAHSGTPYDTGLTVICPVMGSRS